MKKKTTGEKNIKPDLKHDSMEFSAATDGDDRLDTDDASYEEEGINADELDALEDDPAMEAALNEAEQDREADPDNLTDEDWTDDLPDNNEEEDDDDDDEYERNST